MKCICINDTDKPDDIPKNKWVKAGQEYTVIYVAFLAPQMQMAFQVYEIDLDGTPYDYIAAERFIYKFESYDELVELVEFSGDVQNLIASVNGTLFDVCDYDNKIIADRLELEKAERLTDILNEIGDNAPYFIKRCD